MAIIQSPPPANERLLVLNERLQILNERLQIRHPGEGRDPVFVSLLRKPGLDPGLRRDDGCGAICIFRDDGCGAICIFRDDGCGAIRIFRDDDLLVGAASAAINRH